MESLDALRAETSVELWSRVTESKAALGGLASPLTDALFEAVDGEEDQDLRRALLRLKRDIHNQRSIRAKELDIARDSLPAEIWTSLQSYDRLSREIRQLEKEAHRRFDEELVGIRRRFQSAVDHEDFTKGLLLSSLSLADQIQRYQKADPQKAGAKARQIERSLMRYYSRTVMKATPFSTFCTLLAGRLEKSADTPRFIGDPMAKKGLVRLNKTLYALMLPHLIGTKNIRRKLSVEINPTLQHDGERLLFLTSRGAQEVFQRLAPNPVIDLLRRHLEDSGASPWQELVDLLRRHPEIEAETEEAEAYVDRLIEIGLLRVRLGISEQEVDWDRPLQTLLGSINDPLARRIVECLDQLRSSADAYAQASTAERRGLLSRSSALVQELFACLGPARPGAPKEVTAPPFYEDAGGPAQLELNLGELETALEDYIRLTSRLAWPRSEQATMRHFFDSHYGPDPGPLPLLRFYEDYYREFFKGHLERQKGPKTGARPNDAGEPTEDPEGDGTGTAEEGANFETPQGYNTFNPFGLEFSDRLDHGHKALTRRMQLLWAEQPDAEELVLERKDFEAAVADLPPLDAPSASVSLFTQYIHNFRENGSPALVARSYLTGYGKYFSRFLYLLPDPVLEDLQHNNRPQDDLEPAEICGDSKFNANLHPPLLPYELSYPTGETGNRDAQIPTSDVWVERHPSDPHRLRLIRRSTGKEVLPVDLGFLNPRMRPHLFQLLSRFTPVLNLNLPIPDTPHALRDDQWQGVRYRPRISFDGKLILARRQWQIPGAEFPQRGPNEPLGKYFFRIQDWRRNLGLPKEVFLRINVLPAPPKAEGDKSPRPSTPIRQHLYKPQYIDFDNPLLVDLFSRCSETLEHFSCTFEERLPAHSHLVGDEEKHFATEMIFQVDLALQEAPTEADPA